jgi:hypothetical protein
LTLRHKAAAWTETERPTMSTGALDPLIHDPERLRVVATLAALPDGDALALTRLQGMLGLTPASLITRLRELDQGSPPGRPDRVIR